MRKTIIVTLMAVLAFCSALADGSLEGLWQSKETALPMGEDNVEMKLKVTYRFGADGSVEMKQENATTFNLGEGTFVDVYMTITGKGGYTLEGSTLTIVYDRSTIKAELPRDQVRARGYGIFPDMHNGEVIEEHIHKMVSATLDVAPQELGDETYADVVIDGKKMTCTQEGVQFVFTRKK